MIPHLEGFCEDKNEKQILWSSIFVMCHLVNIVENCELGESRQIGNLQVLRKARKTMNSSSADHCKSSANYSASSTNQCIVIKSRWRCLMKMTKSMYFCLLSGRMAQQRQFFLGLVLGLTIAFVIVGVRVLNFDGM